MRLGSAAVAAVTVVAAVAVGAAVGYAVAKPGAADAPRPVTLAGASPIPAEPSVPIDPVRPYAPDVGYPPLGTDLDYRRQRVTGAGHTWSYEVPKGWVATPAELPMVPPVKWRPPAEDEPGGYVLRVLPIDSRATPGDQMLVQTTKMQKSYADERVIHATDDTVWYEYRSDDDHHRFNDFAWVPFPAGGPNAGYAGFELSVAGREVDQAGLDALLATVRDSVRMVR